MATKHSGNVKLFKLAISIASVAAMAGIAGSIASHRASVGSGEGPLVSAVPPVPGQGAGTEGGPALDPWGSRPYGYEGRYDDRCHDRDGDWDDDRDDDRDDDWYDDWDDDWDVDWFVGRDHDRNDDHREESGDGPRFWFQPREGAASGQQAGGRPPRTRTRHS